MHNTYIDRMRIEEVEHVVYTHNGAYNSGNSIGHDIDYRYVQCQDGQESWRGQAEGCYGVLIEKMQRVPIKSSLAGEGAEVGKQSKSNHPSVFPTQIAEVVMVFGVNGLSNPNVGYQEEHHQIDGDHTESVAFRDSYVLDESEGKIGKSDIPVEQRFDFVLEHKKQDE